MSNVSPTVLYTSGNPESKTPNQKLPGKKWPEWPKGTLMARMAKMATHIWKPLTCNSMFVLIKSRVMAKQGPQNKLEYSIKGLVTFYKLYDKWYFRAYSSLSGERVKTSEEFINSMICADRSVPLPN